MDASEADAVDTRDMVVVHTAFRREFGLAPALVRGVATGDRRRAGVVAQHLDMLTAMRFLPSSDTGILPVAGSVIHEERASPLTLPAKQKSCPSK